MTDTSPVADLVEALRADVRSKLLDLLDEVTGRKVLLLDSSIVGPLDLLVNSNDLRDHGVQNFFKLSEQAVTTECAQMIFLVRCSKPELADWIATQILADEASGKERNYVVVFLPRKTKQCMDRLSRANVRANVRIAECGIHFFPFDRDILSMEAPGVFRDFHVMGDPTGVFYAAKALMFLQDKFGVIPRVHAIGSAGKAVVDIITRLRKESQMTQAQRDPKQTQELSQPGVPPVAARGLRQPKQGPGGQESKAPNQTLPTIDEVIIIDRRVDLFSVLCSQFTYQALIDMEFGIKNSTVDLSGRDWAKERNKEQVRLSSEDAFFRDIRDLHIDRLGSLLQEKAQAIQKIYAEKDNVKHPSDMAEYIKKFKIAQSQHPLVETHINLASDLKTTIQGDDYRARLKIEDEITAQSSQGALESIEDWIDDQKPFHEVMRLLCLYSLVNNGVKPKQLDQLKRDIVQAYGYEHLLTLCNLERVGMLRYAQQGKSAWSTIKQKFNLVPEDAGEQDISYAYSGYAPLSARLVEKTRRGWQSCKDALNVLYGPAQELHQQVDPVETAAKDGSGDAQAQASPTRSSSSSVALVVFVGGMTYGEMAALRKLSEVEDGKRQFLVLTTEMLSTRKLFEHMRCEQVFNQPPVEAKKPKPAAEQKKSGGFFWPGSR